MTGLRCWPSAALGAILLLLPAWGLAEQVIETLHPEAYLERVTQSDLRVREHARQRPAEQLALLQGAQWYVPDMTLSSRWEDETRREPEKNEQRGLTSRFDTEWTSLVGTDVTLGLEYQYGEQVSALPSGLPEDYQENQQVSLELEQPILRGFTPRFNRIPIEQARVGWQRYQVEGDAQRLEAQRDARQALADLQHRADRLAVEQALADHYAALLDTTETLLLEGRSTDLEVALARLDLEEQRAAVDRAQAALQRQQRALSLVLPMPVRVEPLESLDALIDWYSSVVPVLDDPDIQTLDLTHHPELQRGSADRQLASLNAEQSRREHWPEVSLFYRFEKDYRESLPDQETEAFGIRFSYRIRDLATRESQARAGADQDTALWQQQDRRQRLQDEWQRALSSQREIVRELALLQEGLALSEQALAHELERYELGASSLLDVERRQEDRLNRQLNLLEARTRLANQLAELAYLSPNTFN